MTSSWDKDGRSLHPRDPPLWEDLPGVSRLLVKVPNWLGDLVMMHPSLRALQQHVTGGNEGTRLSVLVPESLAGFYRATPWIEQVVTHPWPTRWRWRRHLDAAASIHHHAPDRILIVPGGFEAALWPWLARVPQRVGFAREGRSRLLTERLVEHTRPTPLHFSEHLRLQLSALAGADLTTAPTPPDVCAESARAVRLWLETHRRCRGQPIVALAPASFRGAKSWPASRWAALADALFARGVEPVLVVAPWERAAARAVTALVRHKPLISDTLDVTGLVALAAQVDGWIGNDSGPSHVAAAHGTPTLTIFLWSDPRRFAPLGPRSRVVGPTDDHSGPSMGAVLSAWLELSGEHPPHADYRRQQIR